MHPTPPVTARSRVTTPGVVTATTTHRSRGQTIEQNEVQEQVPAETGQDIANPAYVTVRGGMTVNMGDSNFIKCEVSISMPCAPNFAAASDMHAQCSQFIEEKLLLERDAAMGTPSGATDQV